MTALIAMRGYPCSGKTEEAYKLAAEEDAVVVSRNVLRTMLFGDRHKASCRSPKLSGEKFVTAAELALVRKCLAEQKSVVVDDTNLLDKHLIALAFEAIKFDVYFEIFDILTPAEECVQRALRSSSGYTREAIMGVAGRHPIGTWTKLDAIYDKAEAAYAKAFPKKFGNRTRSFSGPMGYSESCE